MNDEITPQSPTFDRIVFGRTILAELPLISLFLVSCVAMSYYSKKYPWSVQPLTIYGSDSGNLVVGLPLFALLPIILLMIIIHRLYNYRFIVDIEGVRAIEGLLSFNKHDMRIEYCNIRGIEVDRGIIGRVLNFGSMKIGSAMQSDAEIHLKDIQNPSIYRDIILERARYQIKELGRVPISTE